MGPNIEGTHTSLIYLQWSNATKSLSFQQSYNPTPLITIAKTILVLQKY